jgi:shikimate kinase
MNAPRSSIILVGFMGAGKSSVGRTLAHITGLPRFDTDEQIAKQFSLTIPAIFEKHGEKIFRQAETETLRGLSRQATAIIVTGGGIVSSPENRALLRELGSIVLLSADEETLFERISRRSNRPLLQTENPRATAANLLRTRLPLYREIAKAEVDTSGLTHEEVARRILDLVES